MLWHDLKRRTKEIYQLEGNYNYKPRINEIVALWIEESPKAERAARERDISKEALAGSMLALDYSRKTDSPVMDKIRNLPSPITGESVLQMIITEHNDHPVSRCLSSEFHCETEELTKLLKLQPRRPAKQKIDSSANTSIYKYVTDLTAAAMAGEHEDLVAGETTEMLEQALLKVRRGSVLITGDPGSGKTVTVQALAHKIAKGDVHPKLQGVRILELNISALTAGTSLRGSFSARVNEIIKTISGKKGKTILFIDEFHLVCGAGKVTDSAYDLGNALKTELSKGMITIIGATTDTEFERYVSKDPALVRRFQRIRFPVISEEQLNKIMQKQVASLAEKHNAEINEEVWKESIRLSNRFTTNRSSQPDLALDLLDAACTTLDGEERTLSRGNLEQSLSQQTGIPIEILRFGVVSRLKTAAALLDERVYGQDEMVLRILNTLKTNPYRLNAENRPLAGFLIPGKSGTGKTRLAQTIAEGLFGDERSFLKLDCSEYAEGDCILKLLGSPMPLSNSEPGVLTEHLRSRATGVILFDELEKAHPSVKNMLLGILDWGEVRSGVDGQRLSLKQQVIICTSNAITSEDLSAGNLGFQKNVRLPNQRHQLMKKLRLAFRQELLNRFDDIILASELSETSRMSILRVHVEHACAKAGVKMLCDEELKRLLIEHAELIESEGGRGIERIAASLIPEILAKGKPYECTEAP